MIQKQIVDYAKSQISVGVGRDAIREALVGAGWTGQDINDSFATLDAVSSNKSAVQDFFPVKSASSEPARGGVIMVNDLISGIKLDGSVGVKNERQSKSTGADKDMAVKTDKPGSRLISGDKSKMAVIVLGIAAAVFAIAAVFLYAQNGSLKAQIRAGNDQINSRVGDLESKLAGATKDRDSLNSQIASISKNNQDLSDTLNFFVVPNGKTSADEADFSLTGLLGGSGKSGYTVVASSGIKVFVKNSKDAKVDAALKNLTGNSVQISGKHAYGTRDVTVSAVNGASAQ